MNYKYLIEYFHKAPFIRLIIPFIFGIIFQVYFEFEILPINISIIICISVVSFLNYYPKIQSNYNLRWIFGFFISIIFILFGISITQINTTKVNKRLVANKFDKDFLVQILESPIEKEKSYKLTGEIISFKDSTTWHKINDKLLIYFDKDSLVKNIEIGDLLYINTFCKEINGGGNPNEFDYKQYLAYKHIHIQTYINNKSWHIIQKKYGSHFLRFLHTIRNRLLNTFREHNIDGQEFAVASALSVGYTDDIDDETKQIYSRTGAMHILSVSGLHVGAIFVLLNYLLQFLEKSKRKRHLKTVIILLVLWFFALLSGFSASVLRAAFMLSFVLIAITFKKSSNIYNSLGVSALILLIYNPFYLFDLGFQLTYIAIFSLIFFYSEIYILIFVKNKYLDKIWQLIAVSISAQIATFGIGFFYFHQFPNLFILTNIVAVPLSTIILYFSSFLFVVSNIPIINFITGLLVKYLTWFLNYSLKIIDSIPYSHLNNIYISFTQLIIIILLIIFIYIYFKTKLVKFLFLIIICINAFILSGLYHKITVVDKTKLVIYNVKDIAAYHFIDNKNNILFTDSILIYNETKRKFSLDNSIVYFNAKNPQMINYKDISKLSDTKKIPENFIKNQIIYWYGKRIAIVNDMFWFRHKSIMKFNVDIVILGNSIKVEIKHLQKILNFSQVVIDSSNNYNMRNNWKQQCAKKNIPCYSVFDQGAFTLFAD